MSNRPRWKNGLRYLDGLKEKIMTKKIGELRVEENQNRVGRKRSGWGLLETI